VVKDFEQVYSADGVDVYHGIIVGYKITAVFQSNSMDALEESITATVCSLDNPAFCTTCSYEEWIVLASACKEKPFNDWWEMRVTAELDALIGDRYRFHT
jgi:hypothetical protein